ncbi:MAG: response regulator transcription factor [Campylobacterota bacterium]|nr:response regulator transcription factor [Campylobacterota bacterium]
MKIILHSDDINLLDYWEKSFKDTCVVFDDIDELNSSSGNIIIINFSAFNATQKDMIRSLTDDSNLVLVLHRTPDIQTAKEVLSYGAKGYGNALMKEHFLLSAVETIKEGLVWLHPEFTSQLINQIPQRPQRDVSWVMEKLSQREKEVAYMLRDGLTYKAVGENLSITPRTVKAHAHSIYAKLHVKDRIALALLLK